MHAPGPHRDCIVSTNQPIMCIHAYIHTSFQNRAGTIAHSPRYVHLQPENTPKTKTVVRIYPFLRHPLLHLKITRYVYLSSCAVGFRRIFTCTCESFFSISVLHNGLLQTKRYVPPSEGKSCITYIGVPGEHVTPLARRYFGLGGSRRFMYVLRLS